MEFTIEELEEIYECLGFTNDECCGTDLSYELEERIENYLREAKGESK